MGKLVNKPINVEYDQDTGPLSLVHEGSSFPIIQVVESWTDTGAWWEGETEKIFFRLQLKDHGLCEIYCENGYEKWVLYKVYD